MHPQEVEAEISEDHDLCDRFLFSLPNNSLLLTPYLLDQDFFTDSCTLLRLRNIINLAPKTIGQSICEAINADADLFEKLVVTIKNNPGVAIVSYAATSEFLALVEQLRKRQLVFTTPEAPSAQGHWVYDFFGSKCGFRQAKMPAPPGFICSNREELLGWSEYFLKETAGCVIKTNRGLAGAGLRIIRKTEVGKSPREFVAQILDSENYWQDFPLVVEEFLPPDITICGGAPNIELKIQGGRVTPLYVCSMRISNEGVFQGIEFGKDSVPVIIARQLRVFGLEYGQILKQYNYRGFFEMDFVWTRGQRLVPIESNLRRTGGTHAFELARRLLGNDFYRHFYLTTNNRSPIPALKKLSYHEVRSRVAPLLFPIATSKTGVVLTVTKGIGHGRLGYVVIGKTRQQAHQIETALLSLLT